MALPEAEETIAAIVFDGTTHQGRDLWLVEPEQLGGLGLGELNATAKKQTGDTTPWTILQNTPTRAVTGSSRA
jgi:hypothetical protein